MYVERAGWRVARDLYNRPRMSLAFIAVLAWMTQPGAIGLTDRLRAVSTLPPCEGAVLSALTREAIDPPPRGSLLYETPAPETLRSLRAGVMSAIDEAGRADEPDWFGALAESALAGYELCAGQGPDSGLLLFRPVKSGLGQPAFVWRSHAARPLIVEVPHTLFDQGTLEQGVAIFDALEARLLIVAGAHRCASARASSCDGASSVCGSLGPYRDSDMAHATESVFQLAHELFTGRFAEDLVLSLHGKHGHGVVVSDGVGLEVKSEDVVARFATYLEESLVGESVGLCRDGANDAGGDELCGTTNVQGRHLNGAHDACGEPAVRSSGRFVHLEQSRDVRLKPDRVFAALDRIVGPLDIAGQSERP